MNILLLTTKYCHADGSPWLISELVEQLHSDGHKITVLNVDWSGSAPIPITLPEGIILKNFSAIRFGSSKFSLFFRWLFSSYQIIPFLIFKLLTFRKFDLLISFSPCSALYSALPVAQLISKDSFLIYWDFFPIHNNEISRKIPEFLLPLLKSLELLLIRGFRRVGLMSRANVMFFNEYFNADQKIGTQIVPIWTSVTHWTSLENRYTVRNKFNIKSSSIVFVFGGQLVAGRGVSELCEAVISANKFDDKIVLAICGSGPLEALVSNYQQSAPSVIRFLGNLPRIDYLNFISACDVGVVVTVSNVSAPTFPSKCLDYFACKLPVLAAIESSSDFGEVIKENELGVSCSIGCSEDFLNAILYLSSHPEEIRRYGVNASEYLKSTHNVQNVVINFLGECNV